MSLRYFRVLHFENGVKATEDPVMAADRDEGRPNKVEDIT